MSNVKAQPPKVSPEQILAEMGQLALEELEQVMNKGYYLLAERKAPHLSKRETELFLEINKGFETDFQNRYDELSEKLSEGTMTPEENREFIGLTEIVEERTATRLLYLIELAQIRKTTVPELMKQLGLSKHYG
ncbi:hypothetical protein [Haliscomenobacter hydrossis]|uniref:Uncharacterized protein n=1 Tax=Haliscomenobacter hydrossis (strain ATCC 27775 / DSM 1100 / LMG 10767 / O) TaxID=760192 RepID=F4KPD7_HALH1|nr:hypothetical protein [Haliscomenobacter hydrossis]AEE49891.1 hypothetical protein Halhy_2006 [Haliscomenobacter hydrossis DSM 1100]